MWEKKTLIHCWWECKIGQSICKTVGRFHSNQKLKKKRRKERNLPYQTSHPNSEEMKSAYFWHPWVEKGYLHHHEYCNVIYDSLGHGIHLGVHRQVAG